MCGLILTCEHEEEEDHDEGVPEVEKRRDETVNLELGDEVMHTIDEEVHCCESRCQESTPPPVVVLQTKHTISLVSPNMAHV